MNDRHIIRHLKAGGIVGFRLSTANDVPAIQAHLDALSRQAGVTIIHAHQSGPVPAIQSWIEDACPDPPVDAGFRWADEAESTLSRPNRQAKGRRS